MLASGSVALRVSVATPRRCLQAKGTDAMVTELAARRRAEVELGVLVERLRQEGFTADAAVYAGAAGEAIVGAVRQWQADLVVMATQGRTGMARWIGGSVADSVLRRTSVPV